MKILLINIDSTIVNIALAKIEKYHKDRGDEVYYDLPMMASICDKIYVSCVFTYNKYLCDEWLNFSNAMVGGSGYSLVKQLPQEIYEMKPKINIGFTTRGCIRKCKFCIVPEKEGKIRAEGDIYDFWDGNSKKIVLLDNNILGLPEQFFKISSQLKKENLRVDFNQGLDFRLLTDDIAKEIFSLKHLFEVRFAFDDIAYKPMILNALEILKRNGLKDWQTRWYIYVGTKDTFDTVYERCQIINKEKQLCYIMCDRDEIVQKNKQFKALATWANWPFFFKYDFFDVLEQSTCFDSYKELFNIKAENNESSESFFKE